MGKKLKITSELRSLVVHKMINEPQKTNAEIGRELNIGTSTIQCWATKHHQVQESREKYRQVVRNQLGKDAERHMKNHMTFAEAVRAIRKEASDLEQPVPGKIRICRALEFVLGRKKAQKLVERRNHERRESKLEPVKAWVNGMPFGEVCSRYSISKSTLYYQLEKMRKPKELQAKVNAKLPKLKRAFDPKPRTELQQIPSVSAFSAGRNQPIDQITNNFEGQAAIVELARLRHDICWYVPASDLRLVAEHLTGGQDSFVSSVEVFIQTLDDVGKTSWIDVIWIAGKKRKHPAAAFEIDISGQRTNALARFQDLVKANPHINTKKIIVVKPEHVKKAVSEMNRPCFENLEVIVTTTTRILEALHMPHIGAWTDEYLFDFLDAMKGGQRCA